LSAANGISAVTQTLAALIDESESLRLDTKSKYLIRIAPQIGTSIASYRDRFGQPQAKSFFSKATSKTAA
jgi:hypothetical protein